VQFSLGCQASASAATLSALRGDLAALARDFYHRYCAAISSENYSRATDCPALWMTT
jgi:hypothetical protein